MGRFSLFVDFSNLFGALKGLDLRVTDYEAFFRHIFEQAAEQWRDMFYEPRSARAQLHRVYWYAVGHIDAWDFDTERAKTHLYRTFERDEETRRLYLAEARERHPDAGLPEQTVEAFSTYKHERKAWYEDKVSTLDGMRRFYRTIRQSTQFIDIKDNGQWKVNIHSKSVEEKGVDTSLAVDMVALVDTYDVAILISGDADMIPSVEYVKSRGKSVAVTEILRGARERWGSGFSTRLRQTADFTIQVFESELARTRFARKGID